MNLSKRLQRLEAKIEENFTNRSEELTLWLNANKELDFLTKMERLPAHLAPTLRGWLEPRLDELKNSIIVE